MAEYFFKDSLKKIGKENDFDVSSAGFIGEGISILESAVLTMNDYGIDISNYKSHEIIYSDLENFDLILCATKQNRDEIIFNCPYIKNKVFLLKEYVGYRSFGIDNDIDDPYGYELAAYRSCAREIYECINLLTTKLCYE